MSTRIKNTATKSSCSKPVVALDIDGTLSDYHGHFLRFAEGWIGKPMPLATDINPGLPLYRHMRVSKGTYRACKLAYRQGGLKRSMPCYEGSSELTRALRKAGAEVWICTSRPYLRFESVDGDTRHWLRRNKIQYDGVIWGAYKYRTLCRDVEPFRIVAALDDLPPMYEQAAKLGISAFLRDQPYNQPVKGAEIRESYRRIFDISEAQAIFLKEISNWKDSREAVAG